MGEEETRVTVNIFGTNYKLKDQTGTSREHIIKVARRVDEKMRDIANSNKSLDFLRIAVLAAMHMADACERLKMELEKEQQKWQQQKSEEEQELKKLVAELANLQQEHRKLTERRDKLLASEQEREQLLSHLRDEVGKLRHEMGRLKQEVEQLRAENERLREAEAERERVSGEYEALKIQYRNLQREYQKLQTEYDEWIELAEEQFKE